MTNGSYSSSRMVVPAMLFLAMVNVAEPGYAVPTSYTLKSLGSGDTTTTSLDWGSSGTWDPAGVPGTDTGDNATLPGRNTNFGGVNGVLAIDLGGAPFRSTN